MAVPEPQRIALRAGDTDASAIQPRQHRLLLGLEASVWLHLLQDGDPWPAEWTRRRRR